MFITALADDILEHVYRNVVYTSPTTVYVGLIEAITDLEAGSVTEATYTGYARQACAFDAAQAGLGGRFVQNTAQESFGQKTDAGSPTMIAIGVWDALTVGNLLSITFIDADAPIFATATLASPGVWTAPAHGLANGQSVRLQAVPGLALPTGAAEDTDYVVANVATDTFELTGLNTSSTGAALAMPYTAVTVNQNDTPQLAAAALKIYLD